MHRAGAVDVHGYFLDGDETGPWQQAMRLAHGGDMVAASELMQGIVKRNPEFAPAKVQASHFLLAADRYRKAHAFALDAANMRPRSPEFAFELIRLLRRFEEHERILRVHDQVDWRHLASAQLLTALAAELGPIGLYSQARALLDAAREKRGDSVQALTVRGTLDMIAGDADSARSRLQRALDASGSDLPHVRWMLSMQPDDARIDEDIARTRLALERVAPQSEDDAYLAFALHNLLHAVGDHAQAWDALERGCRVKRRLLGYDSGEQYRLFAALAAHDWRTAAGGSPPSQVGDPGLVFIVGMHRSGTSVLERVLAGHDEVRDGGESYVFPACMREATDHLGRGVVDRAMAERAPDVALGPIAERFMAYARWRADGRRWFVEKLPSNFLHIGAILAAMPQARILHMVRDPMDTCFSNLRTYFSDAAPYSYDQAELADYYGLYRGLMAHWHGMFPDRILDVDYHAFVSDPERETRRVTGFCGIPFQAGALDTAAASGHVATASLATARRGILKDRGGAWRPYATYLGTLRERLELVDAS